ncbi:MAG: hypothetical protein VXZ82_02240 [Planctomycetota bacterium]|nr:hypothetical protein [Planctomycetota bacterium]
MSADPDKLIAFSCIHCGKRLKSPLKGAGRHIKCPKCKHTLRIPQPEEKRNVVNKEKDETNFLEMDDPLSLSTPAISNLEERQQDAEEIRAKREKERAMDRAKQKQRSRKVGQPDEEEQPNVRPATKDDQYVQPLQGQASLNDDGSIPFDSLGDDESATLEEQASSPSAEKKSSPNQTSGLEAKSGAMAKSKGPESPSSAGSLFEDELDEYQLQKEASAAAEQLPPNSGGGEKSSPKSKRKPAVVEDDLRDLDNVIPDLNLKDNMPKLSEEEILDDAEYRIVCRVCGTAQYVSPSAQGMKVKCPDCFTEFKAPPPPKNWKPKPKKKLPVEAEMALAAEADFGDAGRDQHRQDRAQDLLDKAAGEITEEEEDRLYQADFDNASFVQRTFGFFKDPLVIAQMIVYGFVFGGLFAFIRFSLEDTESYFGRGLLLLSMIGGPLVGLLFALPMLSGGLLLIEAAANKQRYIREIPAFTIFDNFADLLVIGLALSAALIPGYLTGSFFAGDGSSAVTIRIGGMLASGFLLFPIFLLGMMDNGSVVNPISGSVMRSIGAAAESWGGYYLKNGIAYGFIFVVWAILLPKSPMLAGVAGFLLPTLIFFTCQQIGGLADAIGDSLSFAFEPPEEDKEEEDDGKGPHVIEDSF